MEQTKLAIEWLFELSRYGAPKDDDARRDAFSVAYLIGLHASIKQFNLEG